MLKDASIEILNQTSQNTMAGFLGIEITEVGEDYLVGKMPVSPKVVQPYGIVHGGAYVTLAETLGSIGAAFSVDYTKFRCVGLDINSNHIRAVREGWVYARATALHIGKTTQVWEIKITNEAGKLVNISRLTMAILPIEN
jgi:1,4-dihydroxy-2-naphthoyl-CoA hydrolase